VSGHEVSVESLAILNTYIFSFLFMEGASLCSPGN
jgi:hypothetical protein